MAFSAAEAGGALEYWAWPVQETSWRATEANGGAAVHLPAIMNCGLCLHAASR